MRVKSVRIDNFKQFASLRAEFGTLDCLVGLNNSGKTTLLQALALREELPIEIHQLAGQLAKFSGVTDVS